MGAWHVGPFENDDAQDYLIFLREQLARSIFKSMNDFLKQPIVNIKVEKYDFRKTILGKSFRTKKIVTMKGRKDGHAVAEAAAALLKELTRPLSIRNHLGLAAEDTRLYHTARLTIAALINDEAWITTWNEPKKKQAILKKLLGSLRYQPCPRQNLGPTKRPQKVLRRVRVPGPVRITF